jgi:general secretion pathway protein M
MMRLARREKYLVSGAACAIVIFCLFQFVVFPFFDKRERLQRGTKVKENELKQIVLLAAEYDAQKRNSQGIGNFLRHRKKGFTLFSYLEREAGSAEVKDRIKYMKPSTSKGTGPYKESMVEMKLEAVTMEQLVRYLYRIESSENLITIKRISIKQNKKESGYVDAVMQVLTFL